MALIGFDINDPASRMTLKVMLEVEGHTIVDGDRGAPLLITDNYTAAVERVSTETAVLVLSKMEQLPVAIQAMRQGVFGYIFLPFQPGEAGLMVERALQRKSSAGASSQESSDDPNTLEEVEATHILSTLRRCKNNQAKTARILGIGRNTLWRKLKKIETVQKLTHPE